MYNILIEDQSPPKGLIKWQNRFPTLCWERTFHQLKQSSTDTKLIWLQFRILHNILTTNRSVSKFKAGQSELCEFCHSHSETIQHLFWNCREVQKFWNELSKLLSTKCTHAYSFSFNEHLVIFGFSENICTDAICDLIILMGKHFLYKCKVQKLLPL